MLYGEDKKKERLLELGARVRARREELGLSLDQVSEKTKIRSKYLIAVEEGDDSVSPGKTYFRAFLKTYASFLGLDGSAFSMEYREILEEAEAAPSARPKESRPRPVSGAVGPSEGAGSGRPAVSEAQAAVPDTGTSVASREEPLTESQAPTAANVAAPESSSSNPTAIRSVRPRRRMPVGERRRKNGTVWVFLALAAVAALVYYVALNRPQTPADPGTTGGVPGGEQPVTTPPEDPTEDPTENPEDPEPSVPKVTREDPNSEKTIWSVDRSPVELELKLSGESDSFCWVRVSVDGEFSFERTLSPSEEVTISAASEIVIRAGKPWVMNVHVNGRDMGLAGEFGPVKDLVFQSITGTQ